MKSDRPSAARRERRWIRREAIRDARHRQPQPSRSGTVSTPFRESIWARRDATIADLALVLEAEVLTDVVAIAAVRQALADLDDRHVEAIKKLVEAQGEQIDLQLRRGGDEKLPDAAVAVRRKRDQARKVQHLQSGHDAIEAQIAKLRRQLAEHEARVAGARRVAAGHAVRVHDEQLERRALYDGVLLRKHPQRRLIAAILDPAVRALPSWVVSALAENENVEEDPS